MVTMSMSTIAKKLDKLAASLETIGMGDLAGAVDAVANVVAPVVEEEKFVTVDPKDVLGTVGWGELVTSVVFNGGTQGDEMTGITLIKDLAANPDLVTKPGIDLKLNIGNPVAVEKCVHYINDDLNDCFSMEDLTATAEHTSYEKRRAQEIYLEFGGKKGAIDLVCDFHNTTANMGLTLIVSRLNPFICKLVASLYTKYKDRGAHILYVPEVQETSTFLDSLGKHGLTVEIGPLKHGLYLDKETYEDARGMAVDIMEYVVNWNAGNIDKNVVFDVPVHRHVQIINYITTPDKRTRLSEFNPELYGKDFQPIEKGTILQYRLDTGEAIPYGGDRTVWPTFIDEASPTYREPWKDNEAMALTWLSQEKW